MSERLKEFFKDVTLAYGEEFSEESIDELSDNKGEDEDDELHE